MRTGLINFRLACRCRFNFKEPLYKIPCLYRSGNLSHVPTEIAKILYEELGIQYQIDLRSEEEIKKRGLAHNTLTEQGIAHKSYPISDQTNVFRSLKYPNSTDYYRHYWQMIQDHKTMLADIFQDVLASPYERIVFNCHAGKDRTGIIILLFMELLNIDRHSIIEDYVLSANYLLPHIDDFKKHWEKRGLEKKDYLVRIQPKAHTLLLLFKRFDQEFGTVIGLGRALGLNPDLIKKLRAKFFTYEVRSV